MTEIKKDGHERLASQVSGLFHTDALRTLLRTASLAEDPNQFQDNLTTFAESLADAHSPEGGFKGHKFDEYALRVGTSLNILSMMAGDNDLIGNAIASVRKEVGEAAESILDTLKTADKYGATAYFIGKNTDFERQYSGLIVPLLKMSGLHKRLNNMASEHNPDLSKYFRFESNLVSSNSEKYQGLPLAHAKSLYEALDGLEEEIKSEIEARSDNNSILRQMIAHEMLSLTLLSTGIATQVGQELRDMIDGRIEEDSERNLVASRINAALMQAIAVNKRSLLLR